MRSNPDEVRPLRSLTGFLRGLLGAWALPVLAACGSGLTDPGPGGGPSDGMASDTTVVSLDNAVSYQTFGGFGAYGNPLVYQGEDYLGSRRTQALEAVFGAVSLSLSAISVGVVETPLGADDPFGQRRNDNDDAFVIDPAGFDFRRAATVREKVLLPARSLGLDEFLLGPLLNVRNVLSWMDPIRATDYPRYLDEAAETVLAVLVHWRDTYGEVPRNLLLFNEPTSGNRELGVPARPTQEVVDLVKAVGNRLRSEGFDQVRFVVPNEETPARSLQVARAILEDHDARPFVGAIGYHPYPYESAYSSVRRILESSGVGSPEPGAIAELEALDALGRQYGVPVWLTETSEGPGMNDYSFGRLENVLGRAIHIHDNFLYAGASVYFGLNALWDSRSHLEHFVGRGIPFRSETSHMALVDLDSDEVLVTGMGYAIGHYERWLEPGARRIGTVVDQPGVFATAFRTGSDDRVVVVAVNNTDRDRLLRLQLDGAVTNGAVTGELSAAEVRWASLGPFAPTSETEVQVVAEPRSVVTVSIPIR